MWDDSYDSSPTSLGNNRNNNNKTNKTGAAVSSKYDFPDTKKNNRNKSTTSKKKSNQNSNNDIDMLFSPSSASESNSPTIHDHRYHEKEKQKTYLNYDILPPPKQDDILSNMMTASGDFEDSILGELLGGPPKKPPAATTTTSTSMDQKQPTETTTTTIPPIRPGGRSPPSARNAFRFTTESSPASSTASPPPAINRSMTPLQDVISVPSIGTGRPHTNSFDFDYATKTDSPSTMMLETKNNRLASQGGAHSATSIGGTTTTTSAKQEKNEDEVDLGGFMPSSMEPGRAGRRRRNADSRPSTGGDGMRGSLDALDVALGLGVPTLSGPLSGGSSQPINTTPAVATRKSIVDPFAKVESRLSGQGFGVSAVVGARPTLSDSDSDDDLLKPLNRRSISFNKPPIKVTTAVSSSLTGKLGNDDSSKGGDTSRGEGAVSSSLSHALGSSLSDLPSLRPSEVSAPVPPPPPVARRDSSDVDDMEVRAVVRGEEELFGLSRSNAGSFINRGHGQGNSLPSAQSQATPSSVVVEQQPAPLAPAPVPQGTGLKLSIKTVGQSTRASPQKPPPMSSSSSALEASLSNIPIPSPIDIPTISSLSALAHPGGPTTTPVAHVTPGSIPGGTTTRIDNRGTNSLMHTDSLGARQATVTVEEDRDVPYKSEKTSGISSLGNSSIIDNRLQQSMPVASFQPAAASSSTTGYIEPLSQSVPSTASLQRDPATSIQQSGESLQNVQQRLLAHPLSDPTAHARGLAGQPAVHISQQEFAELRVLQEQNYRYLQEQLSSKQIIMQLEFEVNHLRDELHTTRLKHSDEVKSLQTKNQDTIKELQHKYEHEKDVIEKRHKESLLAQEHLHKEELEIYQEKLNNVDVIDKISKQIYQTSDSMKLLEQELSVRHKYLEQMKTGQFEARERLVEEMEKKLQINAQAHEAEVYKLQGIIVHMEQMMNNLKSQHYEEKERLHQEHIRLTSLQDSLSAEKNAFLNRMAEENAYLKQKALDLEHLQSAWQEEKKTEMENLFLQQRKVENDKRDFDNFITSQKRALESKELLLREEEQRIKRLRDELQKESRDFEAKRARTMFELETAERTLSTFSQQQDDLHKEKDQVILQGYQLKIQEEDLRRLQSDLHEQMQALEERELALREGFAEMKLAAQALQDQERSLSTQHAAYESKAQELSKLEFVMEERRIAQARAFREYVENMPNQLPSPPVPQPQLPPSLPYYSSSAAPMAQQNSMISISPTSSLPMGNATDGMRSASIRTSLGLSSGLPKEVKLAQRTLREHRQTLNQLSSKAPRTTPFSVSVVSSVGVGGRRGGEGAGRAFLSQSSTPSSTASSSTAYSGSF